MVADITAFTELCWTLPAEELLKMHSEYVSAVESIGKQTKGNIATLLGDRLLVNWNAASSVGNYAQYECYQSFSSFLSGL